MYTLFGTWIKPSVFIKEDGETIRVYSYGKIIESITFPCKCFIMLEGNVIKNILLAELVINCLVL
jgi:hypothetical protein